MRSVARMNRKDHSAGVGEARRAEARASQSAALLPQSSASKELDERPYNHAESRDDEKRKKPGVGAQHPRRVVQEREHEQRDQREPSATYAHATNPFLTFSGATESLTSHREPH